MCSRMFVVKWSVALMVAVACGLQGVQQFVEAAEVGVAGGVEAGPGAGSDGLSDEVGAEGVVDAAVDAGAGEQDTVYEEQVDTLDKFIHQDKAFQQDISNEISNEAFQQDISDELDKQSAVNAVDENAVDKSFPQDISNELKRRPLLRRNAVPDIPAKDLLKRRNAVIIEISNEDLDLDLHLDDLKERSDQKKKNKQSKQHRRIRKHRQKKRKSKAKARQGRRT